MSIHKTKHGTYEVRWWDCKRQRSKSFKKHKDAKKFCAQITSGVGVNPSQELLEEIDQTFEEFSGLWLRDHAEVHKTKSSVIRDRQIIKDYLIPTLGVMMIRTIRVRDLTRLQGSLRRNPHLAPKSVNNIMGLCRKILEDAASWEYISKNPAKELKPISLPEIDYKFWSFDERERFLKFCKGKDKNLYEVVAFTLGSGLRRGEVEGLLRDCIDLDRKKIIVKRSYCHKTKNLNNYTKGKRKREVPMNQEVLDIVRQRSLIGPRDQVFKLEYKHFVDDRLKPMSIKAGVTPITFHDLRHTFASHLAMRGIPVMNIQKLLGHSDLSTTMKYMHLAPDQLEGITEAITTESNLSRERNEQDNVRNLFGLKGRINLNY